MVTRAGFTAMILRQSKYHPDENKEQSQEHAHQFLWHQGESSQIIRPGRLTANSAYYCAVLQRLEKICEDFEPTLAAKELAVVSQQITVSHFHFSPGNFFYQKVTDVPHPPYFSCFPD
jgi:hypothetical protein